MEGIEEGATHEVLRPDHARGLDQNPAAETREAEAGEGGGEDEEDLEPWAESEVVILVGDNDGIYDIGWDGTDIGHHVDEDVLFDIEGPWVEAEFVTAENTGEDPGANGEDEGECLAEGVCDEEDDVGHEKGCGIAEHEKRVEGDADEDEGETDEPHAKGEGGHFWIVHVADAGAYFGVGRVLFLRWCVDIGELVGHGEGLGAEVEGGGVGIGGDAF